MVKYTVYQIIQHKYYEIEKGTFDFHKTLTKTFDCQIIKDEQVIRVDARFQTYVALSRSSSYQSKQSFEKPFSFK